MLGATRIGVRSARSSGIARRASRCASAASAPRTRPRPYSQLSRRVVGLREQAVARRCRVARAPFHHAGAIARGLGAEGSGGRSGDGDGESSDSDSSSDEDEDEQKQGTGAAQVRQHVGGDGEGESEEFYGRGDFRSVGREAFEGGDLEAGETLKGMYDFVDDIVETQHVPTIRDPFDAKGRFHRCPGKKQGKAALPGTCEIFDVKELHVNNIPLLKRFLNDASMILGRNRTGLCAKCQRKVTNTIKAARQFGLIPTVSDFEIRDTGPGGLHAWAAKGGDHDDMAKAKAVAAANLQKKEQKRFGSLV